MKDKDSKIKCVKQIVSGCNRILNTSEELKRFIKIMMQNVDLDFIQ